MLAGEQHRSSGLFMLFYAVISVSGAVGHDVCETLGGSVTEALNALLMSIVVNGVPCVFFFELMPSKMCCSCSIFMLCVLICALLL